MTRWIDSSAPVARCIGAAGQRGSMGRLLCGHLIPTAELAAMAEQVARLTPAAAGRVHSGGAFTSEQALETLRAALPAALAPALKPGFEWYCCRGAFFHSDAHYGEVLFGAWCTYGPARELVFARLGLRLPATVGDFAVFDPFEPHAVLAPGAASYDREFYDGAAPSVFLGFELELNDAVRAAFGIEAAPVSGPELSSRTAVNAETGELR
jgi:hypothetical protein